MQLIPAQTPPVTRDAPGRSTEDRPGDAAAVAMHGGIGASQTMCDNLHGPAQSLCYSAIYGLSV